jgi:hypothetical protein
MTSQLNIVTPVYNPSYLGDKDWEDWLNASPGKPIKAGNSGMHLSPQLDGSINRITAFKTSLGINGTLYLSKRA